MSGGVLAVYPLNKHVVGVAAWIQFGGESRVLLLGWHGGGREKEWETAKQIFGRL
jgi:hypothetical protein